MPILMQRTASAVSFAIVSAQTKENSSYGISFDNGIKQRILPYPFLLAGGGALRSDEGAPDLSMDGQRSRSRRTFCPGNRKTSLSTIARIFSRLPRAPSMASPARSEAIFGDSGDSQQPCKIRDIESCGRPSLTSFCPARKCSTSPPGSSEGREASASVGMCRRNQSLSGFFICDYVPGYHAQHVGEPDSSDLLPACEPGYVPSNFKLGRECSLSKSTEKSALFCCGNARALISSPFSR
jgi:hypothetical protein